MLYSIVDSVRTYICVMTLFVFSFVFPYITLKQFGYSADLACVLR